MMVSMENKEGSKWVKTGKFFRSPGAKNSRSFMVFSALKQKIDMDFGSPVEFGIAKISWALW
jgi:hypothetical protein